MLSVKMNETMDLDSHSAILSALFAPGSEALGRPQSSTDAGPRAIASLPQVNLAAKREEVLAYFNNCWALTEVLFSGLASDDAFYRRPLHGLRHPLIFYYAHPAALYVNKFRVAGLLDQAIDADFEVLFEAGVDEMRWDNLHEAKEVWPALALVREYRRKVYETVRGIILTHPMLDAAHLPITQQSPMWALVMSFEHERIHFETSAVLMRELPLEDVRTPDLWPALADIHTPNADRALLRVAAADVVLGKGDKEPTFGWDNEYGRETRHVPAFEAHATLTCNADYLAFVKAGGYVMDRFWSREGLAWRRFRNTKCPAFWVPKGPDGSHLYALRTIFTEVELPASFPVCVNYHEAKAYCAWLTEQDASETPYRLITEAEHHALRDAKPGAQSSTLGLLSTGSETPVQQGDKTSKGFHDVFGNVWQWCEDHFHPLDGGAPHPYYADFSAPCYDGEHQLMMGGSFLSTGDEASPYARFHFRPHFLQHAGIRVARSVSGNPSGNPRRVGKGGAALYESDEMLSKYLLMHWGEQAEIYDDALSQRMKFPDVVHLPLVCAELVRKYATGRSRVFDLGCAVGRSAFELASDFSEVLGIDYSHEFIDAANRLKDSGKLGYYRKDSGSTGAHLTARVASSIDRSRLTFVQGDACNLPPHLEGYDAVLLANVLCRLPDPAACLARMQGAGALVKRGGVLVMTTPLSWLPEYTHPSRWMSGLDAVKPHLSEFELLHQEELPFMIREHRRKFEYIVTQASVWRRK
jgi:5-histidylcysteine sulfoxide synthase/putative 4-mercaptohistidine N1-methyltranferase